MNVTELARRLKVSPQELREMLPALGFDIGMRAVKVDDRTAWRIIEQWPQLRRQWQTLKQKEDVAKVAEVAKAAQEVELPAMMTVREYAAYLGLPIARVISELMKNGILAAMNERLDFTTASIIAQDLGFKIKEKTKPTSIEEEVISDVIRERLGQETAEQLKERPPVVVVMGHVDHGKCITGDTEIVLGNGELKTAQAFWEEETATQSPIASPDGEGEFVAPRSNISTMSYDPDSHTMKASKIEALWRMPAPQALTEIRLRSGDKVTTTPEHPFFVTDLSGDIRQVPAQNISEGQFVIIPQKLPTHNTLEKLAHEIIERLGKSKDLLILLHKTRGKDFLTRLESANKQELLRQGILSTKPRSKQYGLRRLRARDYILLGRKWRYCDYELWESVEAIKHASEKQRASHKSFFIRFPQPSDDLRQLGYIMGCLAGDGHIPTMQLSNNDGDIQEAYKEALETIFGITTTKYSYAGACDTIVTTGGESLARFMFEIAGFPRKQKSATITLPVIAQINSDIFRGFIEGWFDTDGYVSPFNWWVEITSKSHALVQQCATLLLQDEIHSVIAEKKGFFTLRIANEPYLSKFASVYHPCCMRKVSRLADAVHHAGTSRIFDLTPLSGGSLLSQINVRGGNKTVPFLSRYRDYSQLSRPFLQGLLPNVTPQSVAVLDRIKPWLTSEISLVPVISVRQVPPGDAFVYDFTVHKTHTFIGNRIVLHNTKLLDAIRKTNVVATEAGGITQHIGAYQTVRHNRKITFIDTPGHEAFTTMRSRGARVADVAILVVAADDGVQPQTVEALNIINAAKVPFVVAVNKMDKPEASADKVKRELSEKGVIPEDWGGKTPFAPISAKSGLGIDALLDVILLVADLEKEKITANPEARALGTIIEAHVSPGEGAVATMLVQNGTLKVGDALAVGHSLYGKVRAMKAWDGALVKTAPPGMPVRILGFKVAPEVGDIAEVPENPKLLELKKARPTFEKLVISPFNTRTEEEIKAQTLINVVIKTDVLGSLEAILAKLEQLQTPEVAVKVVAKGLGNITEAEILQAESSKAIVYGFQVIAPPAVLELAREKSVEIQMYKIIYELLDDIKGRLEVLLKPEILRIALGKLKVLAVFRKERHHAIIGGRVEEGKAVKKARVTIMRAGAEAGGGEITELQSAKQAVLEVPGGSQCGLKINTKAEIQEGDVLELYREEKKERKLAL
ncbi:translation initiation factor IF-2 [Candidatus Uhrbacteria bacterium]|nr:translation initiation factor IF-2 [Candidatus Uhrbacteria bacterium]